MTDAASLHATSQVVAGETLNLLRGGSGPRLLVLHDEWGLSGNEEIWSILAYRTEVVVPIAPGFMSSPESDSIRTVRDLALLYNALIAQLGDDPVLVVGISFGAWIALEMAVMNAGQIAGLALVGPVGLRFGDPDQRNFQDLFALGESELADSLYHHRELARLVTPESTDEEVVAWVRNREATARYCWEPYLHTPGLQRWTSHLKVPVSIICGGDDRFVMDGYFDQFAASFPHPTREMIPDSGHFPHLETPRLVGDAILRMLA